MTPTLLNNRYKIIRALATGGFGHTFLAEDTYLPSRRHCVIKQLKPINNNPQTFQMVQGRFQREAAILEKLGDSNQQIPKLYAYFEEAGQFYLVQEFIGGQTLTDLVRTSGVLNDNSVQNILLDLLPVLDYVHSQGIIHRDVKPDNIILRQSDRKPVLIDFGAVKEVMTAAANGHSIVIGSPGFMPMEQAAGQPTYASDLYGLGLTAIYLLTGKLPQELDIDAATGEVSWHQYAPSVNPALAAVLDKAVRSRPSDRYSTARQMLDDLRSGAKPVNPSTPSVAETVAVSPGGGYAQPVQVAPSRGFSGWKRSAAIAASLICGALIIGVVFAKTRQPSSTRVPAAEQPVAKRTPVPDPEISPDETTTVEPTTASSPQATRQQPVARSTTTNPDSPDETTTVEPTTASSPQATPEQPVARRRITTPESPQTEATRPSFSPAPRILPPASTPPTQNNRASIPTSTNVPAFPLGTPQSVVEANLGPPTKIAKGAFGKTRAASYQDYRPGEVSLGYLFDRETGQIQQTEVAFAQSVDLEQIQTTVDQMMDGRVTEEIRQKLRRVYQRRSNYTSFTIGDLKGEIQRDKSDRIYIGVWDANLH